MTIKIIDDFLFVIVLVKTNVTLWARSTKNPDLSTGPLTRPFTRSLAPLTHSLAARFARALCCTHSLARSLTSLTPSLVGQ